MNLYATLDNEWAKDTLGPHAIDGSKKTPFKVYIYPNFLNKRMGEVLRQIVTDSVSFNLIENDKCKFNQSQDLQIETKLSKLVLQIIPKFIIVMKNLVKEHLEKKTGKKLCDKKFTITANRYDPGNHYLCHNDDIMDNYLTGKSGRAFGFIYYLTTKVWEPDWGGYLTIYDSDSTGEPVSINNKIPPNTNTLVIFEATPNSWHSIDEVFTMKDYRLSLNGWFHYKSNVQELLPIFKDKRYEPCPYTLYYPIVMSEKVNNCILNINGKYKLEVYCSEIRKKFKRNGVVIIDNFFDPLRYEKYNQVLKQVVDTPEKREENLQQVGPYNMRNYKIIKEKKMPLKLMRLLKGMRSQYFLLYLSCLTGLSLDGTDGARRVVSEIRRLRNESLDEDDMDELDNKNKKTQDLISYFRDNFISGVLPGYKNDKPDESDIDEKVLQENPYQSLFRAELLRRYWKEEKKREYTRTHDAWGNELRPRKELNTSGPQQSTSKESNTSEPQQSTSKELDTLSEQTSIGNYLDAWRRKLETMARNGNYPLIKPKRRDRNSFKVRWPPRVLKHKRRPRKTQRPCRSKNGIRRFRSKTARAISKNIDCDPIVRQEIRYIENGSYTVLNNCSFEFGERGALDVVLFFNHDREKAYGKGGYTEYVDPNEERVRSYVVQPKSNRLAIVYRSAKTKRFLKHVSRIHKNDYQELSCVYYEKPEVLPIPGDRL